MPNQNPNTDVTFSESSSLDGISSEKFKMMSDPFSGAGSVQSLQPVDQQPAKVELIKQDLSPELEKKFKDEALEIQKRIVVGMPTETEMEEGKPGAINKHRKWERLNKEDMDRYVEIREIVGRDEILSIEALRLP